MPWEQQLLAVALCYLEAVKVRRLEVIRGAAAPIYDVLVLTLAAQFAVPVGDAQVVVHHALTVGAVLQHGVEERLTEKQEGKRREGGRGGETKLESRIHFVLSVGTDRERSSHRGWGFSQARDKNPISPLRLFSFIKTLHTFEKIGSSLSHVR